MNRNRNRLIFVLSKLKVGIKILLVGRKNIQLVHTATWTQSLDWLSFLDRWDKGREKSERKMTSFSVQLYMYHLGMRVHPRSSFLTDSSRKTTMLSSFLLACSLNLASQTNRCIVCCFGTYLNSLDKFKPSFLLVAPSWWPIELREELFCSVRAGQWDGDGDGERDGQTCCSWTLIPSEFSFFQATPLSDLSDPAERPTN